MIRHRSQFRVRYAEVDQMGYVYYGNYAMYYELGRAAMIRDFGYPYSELEKDGTVMPAVKMNIKYLKPALYDELITIETTIKQILDIPFVTFYHRLYNEKNELINTGEVTLAFFDPTSQKRCPMPERLRLILEHHYTPVSS